VRGRPTANVLAGDLGESWPGDGISVHAHTGKCARTRGLSCAAHRLEMH